MKRPVLLASTLIVVFSVTIFLCRQIGLQGKNPSPLIQAFTNPDGSPCEMPCLFGIRLGKTTFDDAVTLLYQHPLTQDIGKPDPSGNSPTFYYLETPCIAIGLETYGGEFVRHIQLEQLRNDEKLPCRFNLSTATLATSISLFGEPEYVTILEGGTDGNMAIYYPPIYLKIIYTRLSYSHGGFWEQDRFSFNDRFEYLMLTEPITSNYYPISEWLGFVRYMIYWNSAK